MSHARLREVIESALGGVPFEAPVTNMYCRAVLDAMHADLPEVIGDVYLRGSELVVSAGHDRKIERMVIPL